MNRTFLVTMMLDDGEPCKITAKYFEAKGRMICFVDEENKFVRAFNSDLIAEIGVQE